MASSADGAGIAAPLVVSMAVPVDLDEATRRLRALGERFATLVEAIDDPSVRARGLEWTVAETAVHMWVAFRYYAACMRGEVTVDPRRSEAESFPAYVAGVSRREIDAEPERDPLRIAAGLRQSLGEFVAAATEAGPDAIGTFLAGYSEDTTTSVCALICELIVHGDDIARAIGAPWEVDRADAVLAVYSTTAGLPLALDEAAAADKDIHAEIRPRGGTPFSIRIRHGRVWTETGPAAKPDVRVSADPVAYLMVGFGRTPLLRPLLRGRLFAWGRRPWRMLELAKLLESP